MVTTRRGNDTSTPPKAVPSTSSRMHSISSAIPAPTHSPYLPTRTETLLLLVYPTTLLFGSLFSHLSPSLRPPANASVYSPLHQSFQPAAAAPSYFAQKRNVFNVYFVKIGWFWCSFAFLTFLLLIGRGRSTPPRTRQRDGDGVDAAARTGIWRNRRDESDERMRRRYQAVLRYLLCTVAWVFVTQWFFGAPVVDRGFSLTGGACEIAPGGGEKDLEAVSKAQAAVTHAACRAAGGMWRGGYDISGHVFILVLGSGMLWMEMLPFLLPSVKGLSVGRVIRSWGGDVVRVANEIGASELYVREVRTGDEAARLAKRSWTVRAYATTMVLAIVVLSWWMVLMTAAFFHTWVEKVTGWALASAAMWVVYFLPRGWPAMRDTVGMPGSDESRQ